MVVLSDGFSVLVEEWEMGMERVAAYPISSTIRVHILRTTRGTFWVLRYFTLGADARWTVSVDARDVSAEAAMAAVGTAF